MSALLRLGFVPDPNPSGGSHLSMYRQRPDGTKEVTVIILGKKEIPRGTLRNILKLGNISEVEFLLAAGKRDCRLPVRLTIRLDGRSRKSVECRVSGGSSVR